MPQAVYLRAEDDGRVHATVWDNGSKRADVDIPGERWDSSVEAYERITAKAQAALGPLGYTLEPDWSIPEGWSTENMDYRTEVARYVDPATVVYTAGHNDAGYSPDPDSVAVFATVEDARAYLADELDRLADSLGEAEMETVQETYGTEENYQAHYDQAHALSSSVAGSVGYVKHDPDGDIAWGVEHSGGWTTMESDGRPLDTAYWIHKSTIAETFGPDVDVTSDEYVNLIENIPDTPALTVYVTASTAQWIDGEQDPIEQHGWVDLGWSTTTLHENQGDVRPLWTGTDPLEAAQVIQEKVGPIESVEPGRGTYYGAAFDDWPSGVNYSHAAHLQGFSREQVTLVDQALVQAQVAPSEPLVRAPKLAATAPRVNVSQQPQAQHRGLHR